MLIAFRYILASEYKQLSLQVEVMSTIEHRDRLFGSDQFPFDPRRTLFVWTGDTAYVCIFALPFSVDTF
jgi:hypothetical protein